MKRRFFGVLFVAIMLVVAGCGGRGAKLPGGVVHESEWARTAVFYEIFVRSFYDSNGDGTGDFEGMRQKIGYLKELGVNAVWLMPINPSPSYHGYDVTDYRTTNPQYGTMEEFKAFVREAHANGIKVIIDLVANHSSSEHPWFKNALTGSGAKYRNYYVWAGSNDNVNERGPWGQTIWYSGGGGHYEAIFWSGMPDLNYKNPAVRNEMKAIARFWLDPDGNGKSESVHDEGVDGFRLDAAKHINDKEPSVTHGWWKEFRDAVKAVYPNAFIVGENWDSTNVIAPFYAELDSSFNFPLADQMMGMVNGRYSDLVPNIAGMYNNYQSYAFYNGLPVDATFLRNHDMDRVASTFGGDTRKIKLAASLLLTLPGTPFIYYGEELGQLGTKPDPDIRLPFEWNTYLTQKENDASIWNHYRRLIAIRKANPVFFNGAITKDNNAPSGTYGYTVSDQIRVVHNYWGDAAQVTTDRNVQELLSETNYNSGATVNIGPFETVIMQYR